MLSIRQDLFRMKCSHVSAQRNQDNERNMEKHMENKKIEAGIISRYLQFLCYRYGQDWIQVTKK